MRHLAIILVLLLAGCEREDMASEPKDKPMQPSAFFADGSSARPPVIGAISRDDLQTDSLFYRGLVNHKPAAVFPDHYPTESDAPFPTRGPELRRVLDRGRQQFTIYCAMCHGDSGDGQGIIVQRGFPVPPSYQLDRLRTAPVGHFFDVINNGYGAMYSYGDRISAADRWAIVAYIRTLQMTQATSVSALSPSQKNNLTPEAK